MLEEEHHGDSQHPQPAGGHHHGHDGMAGALKTTDGRTQIPPSGNGQRNQAQEVSPLLQHHGFLREYPNNARRDLCI